MSMQLFFCFVPDKYPANEFTLPCRVLLPVVGSMQTSKSPNCEVSFHGSTPTVILMASCSISVGAELVRPSDDSEDDEDEYKSELHVEDQKEKGNGDEAQSENKDEFQIQQENTKPPSRSGQRVTSSVVSASQQTTDSTNTTNCAPGEATCSLFSKAVMDDLPIRKRSRMK